MSLNKETETEIKFYKLPEDITVYQGCRQTFFYHYPRKQFQLSENNFKSKCF